MNSADHSILEGLRDVKPPVDAPVNVWFWVLVGLIVLAATVLLLVYFLKKRGQADVSDEPPKPSWVIAGERLKALKQKNFLASEQFTNYFFELSLILREYIELRFSIRAPDMTTEEFLQNLKTSQSLSEAQKGALKAFLTQSDMVKFAKFTPSIDDGEKSWQLAWQFVQETKEEVKAE